MSQIRIDDNELQVQARMSKGASAELRAEAWALLRKAAFDTEKEVKRAMPVDTGRARASFGVWDDHLTMGKAAFRKRRKVGPAIPKQMLLAGPSDSIHQEDEAGLRIVFGSNLPYIGVLNEGHSKQAAPGFIDMAVYKAEQMLAKALAAVEAKHGV